MDRFSGVLSPLDCGWPRRPSGRDRQALGFGVRCEESRWARSLGRDVSYAACRTVQEATPWWWLAFIWPVFMRFFSRDYEMCKKEDIDLSA